MHRSYLIPAFGIYMLWMFGDEVLCQVAKSELCGIIQGDCGRFLGALGNHGTTPPAISLVNPKPCRKVWLLCIQKTFLPLLYPCRYLSYSRCPGPVPKPQLDPWDVPDAVLVNALV